MLQPIIFETEGYKIHSFSTSDIDSHHKLATDVLTIFSDPFTLKFVPEKRMKNVQEAEDYVKTMIINHHIGRNYSHFITSRKQNQIVGVINLVSPKVAKEYYKLEEYPHFIEFYLLGTVTGQSIMSDVLPVIVGEFQARSINEIAAVVNRDNKAAIRVLEKSDFQFKNHFDIVQDLYWCA